MNDRHAWAADLAFLSEALYDAGKNVDLSIEVELLAAHVAQAVESYLGLSLTIDAGPAPLLDLRVMDGRRTPATIRSSLHFSLPGPRDELGAVEVTMYAGRPAAFVDLGADVADVLGLPPTRIVLDRHLESPLNDTHPHIVDDLSVINHAIGVLIHCDHDPETAHAHLVAAATSAHTSVSAAAAQLLASTGYLQDRPREEPPRGRAVRRRRGEQADLHLRAA